jgi:hypothetical protein
MLSFDKFSALPSKNKVADENLPLHFAPAFLSQEGSALNFSFPKRKLSNESRSK